MSHTRLRGNTPEGSTTTNGTNRTTGRLNKKQAVIEELQEIQDASKARIHLEKTQLIVPPGEPITIDTLVNALHHITEYQKVPKTAIDAIRSVAFLLKEIEDNTLHETVRDSVTVQLNELGRDLKDFVTDATQQIDNHVNDKLSLLSEATKELVDTVKSAIDNTPVTRNHMTGDESPNGFKQALLRPPSHIDPRIAAKEGIRLRQFILEGVTRDSALGKMNAAEAKKKVNRALDEAGSNGIKARSALRQNNLDFLIEMETDSGAAWLSDLDNAKSLCSALGQGLAVKQRPFNVLVYNAPTTLNPDSPEHIKEIIEVNDIKAGGLLAMRWVKPTNRRDRADQRTAHLILMFSNADDANRAILSGTIICHRRLRAAKMKKEPIRCMKCHHWNHIARECTSNEDTCGTCGEKGHWTKDCANKGKIHCVSCNTDEHASWSRSCPTFLKKCSELDSRTPENNLPFYPSAELWTWTSTPPAQHLPTPAPPPPITTRGQNQQERAELQRNFMPSGRPYERRSWNRPASDPQQFYFDKPLTPRTPIPYPPAEQLTDMNAQVASSQDDFYV